MKSKIKIFRKLVRCASIALLSFSMAGCGADFLDTTPTNNISGSSIWTKATLAEQAVIGVYNVFLDQYCPNSGILDSHRIPWDAYSSVMDTDKNWIKRMPNCTGAATPSSGLFSDIYKRFYTFIYRANDVIDNIGQVPDMSTGEKQRAIAECKFLRAFAYMRLNILYKGVPLYMNAITSPENGNKARSSEADVWAAVLQDLTDCVNEPNLPGKYNSGDSNYGRVTKGAAYAYIGWAHLTRAYEESGNKDTELKAAVDAFNNVKGYDLVKDFKSMFNGSNKNSKEGIFELQMSMSDANGAWYKTQLHRWIGCSELWGWDEILPNTMLMNEYMKEGQIATTGRYDSRLYETIFFQCDYFNDPEAGRVYGYTYDDWFEGKNKPAFRKFMPVDYEGMENNYFAPNIPLMRYSNVLLMKAEALNELGQTAEAISLINQVRERADMPNMKGTSQAQVREQIEHERILEFPLENFRFYDLRRWGKTQEALKAVGRDFNPEKNSFYPIPIQEINTNNALH